MSYHRNDITTKFILFFYSNIGTMVHWYNITLLLICSFEELILFIIIVLLHK